ncbi:MAG: alpha/beta fold hydrolase [Gammaproteobacteria bacterium]|jgi:pimeloyl-ACP methyl ester carboxylesterase|tara:strand:+ start:599 stop:1513 length:915 start_codon:yes stop_codon:yes gene_type:complete
MNKDGHYNEGFSENSGVKIFYRDYGPKDGDPILMVHGLGAQLVHWPIHLINFLQANNFRPITYDNRDVGLSSRFLNTPSFVLDYVKYFLRLPIKSEYTIDDMARDGINLLDTLNIKKTHIFSTSMGGMIAQIISAQYPERVKSFTLIASTASTPSPTNAPKKAVRDIMMERSKNPNASHEEILEREIRMVSLIGMDGRIVDTPEFREETIRNLDRAQDGSGYARQLLSILASKDRLKKIQKIKAPTLIIHGKNDPMIHVKNAYKMHKLIPHSKLKIIENMRHLIEPEVLNQFEGMLLEHLNQVT